MKTAMFSISVARYRAHRPHRYECSDLQSFPAVGISYALSTANGPLPTALLSTARGSTVQYYGVLRVFLPLHGSCGRCRLYFTGFPCCTAIPSTEDARGNCTCYFGH